MNAYDLRGRTAVVTGGARGIGFAIPAKFIESDANVMVCDVDEAALDPAMAALGSHKVDATAAAVTDSASIEAARDRTIERFGKIDVLVNNAGISGPNLTTWDYPLDDWHKVIAVDLTGVFLCCRAIVPYMIENGYGRIVNVTSIAGKEGPPNAPAYSAAKAGAIGLTKSLGKELSNTNIRVNCVAPAAVKTDIFAQMTQPHID